MKTTRKMKREAMKKYNAFKDVFAVIKHYFPDFIELLSHISDPRHQSYITYSSIHLIMTRLFSFFCHHRSLRHMNESFNNECVINNFKILFDAEYDEIPHGDTINNYFKNISIDQLREVIYGMVRDLIKKKCLIDYRIQQKYYQVIIDGVGMHSYHINHIDGSLIKRHNDEKTTYHTDMLVAYMAMGNVMIPIDFEPIENVGIVYDKQDCEMNAAKRLLKRIKRNFKRLQICISADALYFNDPMIKLVESLHWKYIFTFKEGCSKEAAEYYEALQNGGDTVVHEKHNSRYEYYNGVEYKDNIFNMISYTKKDEEGNTVEYFCYATNLRISEGNYKKMIEICRGRWKIENKGFNELKNHGYHMKHAFSYDENAVKVHFVLMLISHLIMQLVEHYEKSLGRFETIRKLGEDIKEALRNAILSATDIRDIATRFYISRLIPY